MEPLFTKTLFIKEELHSLINSFEKYSTKLEEPMFSWDGDGAYSAKEAREVVEEGRVPREAFIVCSKRPDDEYWENVFIEKEHDHSNEYKYLITTREMGRCDELSNDEDECMKLASKMLASYF